MKMVCTALLAGMVGCAFAAPTLRAEAASSKEKLIYSFCSEQNCPDGESPHAGLLDVNGILYGTTSLGGIYYGSGVLFSINPKTNAETVLHDFGNSGDGQEPDAAVIALNGMLYGTTTQGGAYGYGSVFSLDPNTGAETVLHSFNVYTQDSIYPVSGLVAANGVLYGTTPQGGAHGLGDVYSVDPANGNEKVVYSFPGSSGDGYSPDGSLLDVKRVLYGTTTTGGAYRSGTVFSLNPKSGAETVLYSFCPQQGCADGNNPVGSLIESKGTLFGTATGGGAYNSGVVFSLDPVSGVEKVLYSFCAQQNCADGGSPSAGLIEVNGTIYGTTELGGSYGYGAVFSLDSATGAESVLYSFDSLGPSGYLPNGGLVSAGSDLYGTAYFGGSYGGGTLFKIKP